MCAVIAMGGWFEAPPHGRDRRGDRVPWNDDAGMVVGPHVVAASRRGAIMVAAELAVGSILIADALVVAIVLLGAAVGPGVRWLAGRGWAR
jgi:hypothetical protein